MSKPLQVYLDEEDVARLDAWSKQRGWSKSQTIRLAIRALTRLPGEDPLLAASGMIDGLPSDLSSRFEQYLEETYLAKTPPARRRARGDRSRPRVRR